MKSAFFAVVLGVLGVCAGLAVPVGSLGYRFELLDLGGAFAIIRGAFPYLLAGASAAGLGVILALTSRAKAAVIAPLVGLAASGAGLYTLNAMNRAFTSHPPIHDVTTDLENPPAFVDVAALRAPGDHPTAFAASYVEDHDVMALHQDAYADLTTLMLDAPPDEVFDRALAAAQTIGWELVAAEPADGRIEATATSFWFGFKDDIVVRIMRDGEGARLDVRSQSRIGGSDLGANAARVRRYLARVAPAE